jgi:hypothetical protein
LIVARPRREPPRFFKTAMRKIDAQVPRQHLLRISREVAKANFHINPPVS